MDDARIRHLYSRVVSSPYPFRYEQQEEAYRHFSANVGFDPAVVTTLLHELRTQYETLIVVGYSVGATLAWLSAASGLCDGVICYYGSRIRQYLHLAPLCPTLVIIARYEPAFDPRHATGAGKATPGAV